VTLTREQQAAVGRRGQDVCVVAGPGSGKTRVLVERFRRLVDQGVSPLRLLAVTFTEKAANELKERLARDFVGSPQLRLEIERAPVCTIDAFCAHLLREHSLDAGVDPRFEVLDATGAGQELSSAAQEALDGMFEENPDAIRALLLALDLDDPVRELMGLYQAMRVTALDVRQGAVQRTANSAAAFLALLHSVRWIVSERPRDWNPSQKQALAQIQEWGVRLLALEGATVGLRHFGVLAEFDCNLTTLKKNNPVYEALKSVKRSLVPAARQALIAEYYAPQRALLFDALERLDRAYRARKQARYALDFSDLEESAIRLLRDNEPLRARVRDSFDEVLMDELQDTNPLQAMLIDLVRKPDGFFAVGDVNQSIYGFRHADPEVFKRYREGVRSQGWAVDELLQNHRSRGAILYAAETILRGADGIELTELVAARPFHQKDAPSVDAIAALAQTTEEAAKLEGRLVARRIRELADSLTLTGALPSEARPVRFADMAVLVRNVNALPPLESALHELGIPYLLGRGKRFYEQQEVTDLVHLLRVIRNPRDEISMAAVLRSPLVGVRNETLLRLKQLGNLGAALGRLDSVDAAVFDAGDLERLRAFQDRLRTMRAQADDVAPDRLLLRAIDAAGYENALSPRRRANLKKLLGRLREWFEGHPRPLGSLVEELEFLRESNPDESGAPPEDSSNAVRLMTIHSAKGLEFPVVFLAAMHKGVANDSPPLAFSPKAGLVARWLDPVSGEPVKDLPYTLFSEELRRKSREEENRLLYVAMTRAEEHLVLSFAFTPRGPANWADKVASGLELNLGAADNVPRVHQAGAPSGERRFPVRVLCADQVGVAAPVAAAPAPVEPEPGLARPVLTGQYDAKASVTSIALFRSCPRRYYLSRYLGWQAAPRGEIARVREVEDEPVDASELGRQVHDLLAAVPVANATDLACELASRFQKSPLAERARVAPRVEREFDFLLAIEDVVVEGRIDLWFEEVGQLLLVDYKTDDVDAAGAAARARDYAPQLHLYALALERLAGRRPDQALLYFLRPDVTVRVSVGPTELAAARDSVKALQRAQSEMRFPINPADHCRRCPFYHGLCPAP
jgi:ATP-dependent exoDNAse (exonuclease V) beta subunit